MQHGAQDCCASAMYGQHATFGNNQATIHAAVMEVQILVHASCASKHSSCCSISIRDACTELAGQAQRQAPFQLLQHDVDAARFAAAAGDPPL